VQNRLVKGFHMRGRTSSPSLCSD